MIPPRANLIPRVLLDERLVDIRLDECTGRIVSIDATADPASRPAALFAMPGLIDAHTHTPPLPGGIRELWGLLHLVHGVTTIREMAGHEALSAPAAAAVAEGRVVGPRVFHVGQAVDGTPAALLGSEALPEGARSVAAVEQAVGRRTARGGPHLFGLKCFNRLGPDARAPLLREARRHGMAVVGHAPESDGPQALASCGYDDIQHLTGVPAAVSAAWGDRPAGFADWLAAWSTVDEGRLDWVAEQARRSGHVHTPTLALYFHQSRVGAATSAVSSILADRLAPCSCVESVEANVDLRFDASRGIPRDCCTAGWASRILPTAMTEGVWGRRLLLPYFRCMCAGVEGGLPAAFPSILRAVAGLHRRGVTIHAGTDCMTPRGVPGRSLWEEVLLLRACEFSDGEALDAATVRPGAFLQSFDRVRDLASGLGTITVGGPADLCLTCTDPRRDLPRALAGIEVVVADGRIHTIADLRRRVLHAQERARRWYDRWMLTPALQLVGRGLHHWSGGGRSEEP